MKQRLDEISIPDEVMDQVALSLLHNSGVATLVLPDVLTQIHKKSFQIAHKAIQKCQSVQSSFSCSSSSPSCCPMIDPQHTNSATVTGYHASGEENGMGRYNIYREGFVFSNGELFHIDSDDDDVLSSTFEKEMGQMFDSMCRVIGKSVLRAIARYLKINQDWFKDQYGSMENSSQWHVKRFVEPCLNNQQQEQQELDMDQTKLAAAAGGGGVDDDQGDDDVIEWLPVHTDPSLISVIIHDSPGMNKGAMGLEYQTTATSTISDKLEQKKRIWNEVESHGHAVATIFCGSLMSYITGGLFQSAKHRVVYRRNWQQEEKDPSSAGDMEPRRRITATLFMRPGGDCYLAVPPSDILMERTVKVRRNCKFEDWIQKVSRNYQHGKKHKNSNQVVNTTVQKDKAEVTKDVEKMTESKIVNGDPVYWADEYTELTLHGTNPPLEGREKYLGGEVCMLNNHIYTIPGFARRIMDIDVSVEPPKFELFGPDLPGEYKWLRGIPIGDTIYGIPCHSDAVLKINALTREVTLLRWDENVPGACPRDQKWKYHGAAVSDHDGCIYCIPQAAEHVMKINPMTNEISFIGPSFPGVNKWYGGLLLSDGGIYGICQNARGILRIDPKTQNCTVHGDFLEGHYKWHGAVKHTDGNLYCIPAHADRVLKVEPGSEPRLSLLGENLKTGAHRNDGKYKFLGGAVSGDCVYFFPSDSDYVCEVNTITGKVRDVGPNLRNLENMRNNKWQNGFTACDGTIYGIPLKGQTVLRIRRDPLTGEPDVCTIGGPYLGLNKWEGGVSVSNGDMYCMPLNHKYSLRIRPRMQKQQEKNNNGILISNVNMYEDGNATLRSSSHTTKYSKSRAYDPGPKTAGVSLPIEIRAKFIQSYDSSKYNFRKEVQRILTELSGTLIGEFRNERHGDIASTNCDLESFIVPSQSLLLAKKSKSTDRKGEIAQRTLSDHIANDEKFLNTFDRFVCEVILPMMKERLSKCDAISNCNDPVTFYYQRPPTLRIQPGPSTRSVTLHCDATYGHQDGELNFWLPLTDLALTKTDLWCESQPGQGDYAPLGAQMGEFVSFHGSSCRHYAPANESKYTRVSLDFRVGAEPYFDANWKMCGTKFDHTRKMVVL